MHLVSILLCTFIIASISLPAIALNTSSADGSLYENGERVVIGYESDSDLQRITSYVHERSGAILNINAALRSLTVMGMGSVDLVRDDLSRHSHIRYIESDAKTARVLLTPNDPHYDTRQWNLKRIEAHLAWDITLGLESIVVAIVDTGVAYNHQDLAGNMWSNTNGHHGYDFVNKDDDPMDDQNKIYNSVTMRCEPDEIYHGTHVAGIIGAVTNNNIGIAGIAQVKIMAVKVLDDCGEGYLSEIAQGIVYAADQGARVMTLSLGGADMRVVREAALYAWNKGVVIVAAAGNTNSPVSYPAAYPTMIAVGSTGQNNERSSFSNYGTNLELMAPGESIFSATPIAPLYQWHTGTSQAAPHVAGVAALVLSRNPSLLNTQVRTILNQTATDLGTMGWDPNYGWGLVNAYRAVQEALTGGRYASILDAPQVRGHPGDPVTITATLKMIDGKGIPNRTLDFYVQSVLIGSAMTDYSGATTLSYTLPTQWGMHELFVNFTGDSEFAPSSKTTTIFVEIIGGGNIAGVVLSYRSYERLQFSQVTLVDAQIELLTDPRGEFTMNGIPPGSWQVTASLTEYETATVTVIVTADETSLVAIVLRPVGTLPPAAQGFPLTAIFSIIAILVVVVIVFLVMHNASKKRIKAMGGPIPKEIPPHVAQWLSSVHGIDPNNYEPLETMPVADGRQLTLIEKATGHVIVVRIDKFGRPVYLYLSPD